MEPRVIRTDEEHAAAFREIESLAARDPKAGTPDGDRLELLSALVENYEKAHFVVEIPDPISAIRFRMEQQGLSQADLVPYLGSRSRVSEVLAGKRPLSLAMIRSLRDGLGIPADVLIGKQEAEQISSTPHWSSLPLALMVRRGWFTATREEIRSRREAVIEEYVRNAFDLAATSPVYKKSIHERAQKHSDPAALLAWTARVLDLANASKTERFAKEYLDEAFLKKVARLSSAPSGPLAARETLAFNGVVLVLEPSLPKTHVDGCSLLLKDGRPVIGMTARYDRLDSFWFVLLHELAHVMRHLNRDHPAFVDDLDDDEEVRDPVETEADFIAAEALIPRSIWRRSSAWRDRTAEAVRDLAQQLSIHPAIPAGRLRRETRRYTILSDMLGQGEVSAAFKLRTQQRGTRGAQTS